MSHRMRIVVFLLIAFVAAALRFYGLGEWSWAGDEPHTKGEFYSLIGRNEVPPTSQVYRLPRMIPVGFVLQGIGYSVFGVDAAGARAMPAILGGLSVVLVLFVLPRAVGYAAAGWAALYLATWHRHIFFSQHDRFYAAASLFVVGALVLGAVAAERRSTAWLVAAVLSGALASGSHAVQAAVFAAVLLPPLLCMVAERRVQFGPGLVMVCTVALVAIWAVMWVLPLSLRWNAWAVGNTSTRAVMATVGSLGPHLIILSGLGVYGIARYYPRQVPLWVASLGTLLAVVLVLPRYLVYRQAYVFPLEAAVVLLAGIGTALVLEQVSSRERVMTILLIGLFVGLQIPSVASHLVDGSRYDHETAVRHIRERAGPRDRIFTHYSTYWLKFHPAEAKRVTQLPESSRLPALAEHLRDATRPTWVSLHYGRIGMPAPVRALLEKHGCIETLENRKRRFDYYQFQVRVFRCPETG